MVVSPGQELVQVELMVQVMVEAMMLMMNCRILILVQVGEMWMGPV